MLEKIYTNTSSNTDLNMYKCGIEDCDSDHSWGPAVRDHYLIHFILDGKGSFKYPNETFTLEKGQGFLISPGRIAYYQADAEDPWSYAWIGFHGLKAEKYLKYANLDNENPVFKYNDQAFIRECFNGMISTKGLGKSGEIRRLGFLYMLLSQLIEEASLRKGVPDNKDRKEEYIKKVVEYVRLNFSREITVKDIASYIGLDRSYLSSIFSRNMMTSIQKFIISFRIEKACELMKDTTLSLADISRSVGYKDPLLFSKIFKRFQGLAPREFRKNIKP